MKITSNLRATLLGGASFSLRVVIHGDAIACLSSVSVEQVKHTTDGGISFVLKVGDGLNVLSGLLNVLSAYGLDVDVSTKQLESQP